MLDDNQKGNFQVDDLIVMNLYLFWKIIITPLKSFLLTG